MKAYMLLPQKRCACASFFGIDITVYSPGVNPCLIAFMAIVAFPRTGMRQYMLKNDVQGYSNEKL